MLTDPEEDYARGFVPFLDCTIYLDSRPLIPRVETEYWVECAIAETKMRMFQKIPYGNFWNILDLFAGSGAIGVAVLKHLPNTRIDFGEIDAGHFPTIEKNIRENGIAEERTRVIETDVYSNMGGAYDAIFANPPYIAESRKDAVQDSVIAHEPARALFADEDGFALIRKTVLGAPEHLAPGGTLYIEHDPEQSEPLRALAAKHGFTAETRKDQYGVLRYSVLKLEPES